MLGFKKFENAAVTISGIELIHRIRKEQFNTSDIDLKERRTHELWQSVLAA
jgi:transposase-like protein